MPVLNYRWLRQKLVKSRKPFRSFLLKSEKNPPPGIDKLTKVVEKEVWQEIDCLACGNCCKRMTPTFTEADIKRIAAHFGETPEQFKKLWLKRQDNDWVNIQQPCQFLDKKTNYCMIYEIRPADCADFPHLSKSKWESYAHVHKQNIDYCPATYKFVERLKERVGY